MVASYPTILLFGFCNSLDEGLRDIRPSPLEANYYINDEWEYSNLCGHHVMKAIGNKVMLDLQYPLWLKA